MEIEDDTPMTPEARAMRAGCEAVSGHFRRFRAGIVQELARCPRDDTARRAQLVRALDGINLHIDILSRMPDADAAREESAWRSRTTLT